LFVLGEVGPDSGAIDIATLIAIFQDAGYLLGRLAIGDRDGGTDKAKAFGMRGGV
jgi:hypothetical protein